MPSLRRRARGKLREVQVAVTRTVEVGIINEKRGPERRAPQSERLRDPQQKGRKRQKREDSSGPQAIAKCLANPKLARDDHRLFLSG